MHMIALDMDRTLYNVNEQKWNTLILSYTVAPKRLFTIQIHSHWQRYY